MAARARGRRVRPDGGSRSATSRGCTARRSPAAIRLNYGMQRVRGGGNATRLIALLPCLVGAWRHRAGGLLLSARAAGSRRAATRDAAARPDLLAGPHAAHRQHEHHRRRPAARDRRDAARRPRVRAADRGAGRLQQQPGGGRAASRGRWRAGFRARGPVHRRARALPDRHRRPRRLRAARHHAAGALGRARQLRPHLRRASTSRR